MNTRTALITSVCIATLVGASLVTTAHAESAPAHEKLHANAVSMFQQARFSEAYGRFIALADAGHAPAAELALFMAQNSNALFGKDWDVTQEQLTDWAALTGRPAPVLKGRIYLQPGAPVQARGAMASR